MANPQLQRTTALAIEVLTAQFDDASSTRLVNQVIDEIAVAGVRAGGDAGGVMAMGDLCAGLITIAGLAIGDLSEATGVTPQQWLQQVALRVQSG
jgi:hypothetical protein